MGELRLTIGVPGSGKTSYAEKLLAEDVESRWKRINWDLRRIERGMHLRGFNRKEEDQMQKDSFAQAAKWGAEGLNVIVDNTNLNESTRNKWKGVAQRTGMVYTEIRMEASLEECIARDAKRPGLEQCGRAVIERMALFGGLIKFDPDDHLVIVDMDGTLADCSHRKHFISNGRHDWNSFEGSLVLQDAPRMPIVKLVDMFQDEGFEILIVSGRSIDRAGKATVGWLENFCVPYKHIFMRNGGDNRPDNVVKQEILDRLPKDQIVYVLDDRDQVVKMWRDNGLTCLQVAEGNF